MNFDYNNEKNLDDGVILNLASAADGYYTIRILVNGTGLDINNYKVIYSMKKVVIGREASFIFKNKQ